MPAVNHLVIPPERLRAACQAILDEQAKLDGKLFALFLCKYLGGRTLPTFSRYLITVRNEAILARYHGGWSPEQLARRYRMTIAHIHRIIAEEGRYKRRAARADRLVKQERARVETIRFGHRVEETPDEGDEGDD